MELVSKDFEFIDEDGKTVSLSSLFQNSTKNLVVYHMMFQSDWSKPCSICSFWVDGISGQAPHIRQKTNIVVIGKASIEKMKEIKKIKNWDVKVLSSEKTDFNAYMNVEHSKEAVEKKEDYYNYGYGLWHPSVQKPGLSVFYRPDNQSTNVYHTYSVFARGLDDFNVAHSIMDMLVEGRNGWGPKHKETYQTN